MLAYCITEDEHKSKVYRLFYSCLQWVCVPFAVTNPATSNITQAALTSLYQEPWIGKLEPEYIGTWMDELLLLVKENKLCELRVVIMVVYR